MPHLLLVLHHRQLAGAGIGLDLIRREPPVPGNDDDVGLLSGRANILLQGREMLPTVRDGMDDGQQARIGVNPSRGLVEGLDWVKSNSRSIHGGFHARSTHGGPGHEGNLCTVSLDDAGLAGFRQVRPGSRVDDSRRVQDLETAHEWFMTMVGIRVVRLVHDVEACSHVRLEHPLLGPGKVASVVRM